jgi:hypothetical protein
MKENVLKTHKIDEKNQNFLWAQGTKFHDGLRWEGSEVMKSQWKIRGLCDKKWPGNIMKTHKNDEKNQNFLWDQGKNFHDSLRSAWSEVMKSQWKIRGLCDKKWPGNVMKTYKIDEKISNFFMMRKKYFPGLRSW